MADKTLTFLLPGTAASTAASRVQRATTRSSVGPDNALLTDITITKQYDLSATTRARASQEVLEAEPDDLLALEMEDGFILYSSAAALADELRATAPTQATDEPLRLDALRRPGPASRGLGEWVVRALSVVGLDSERVVDAAVKIAKDKLKEELGERARELIGQGATWAAVKALLWAIEGRGGLLAPGLYPWTCDGGAPADLSSGAPITDGAKFHDWKEDDPILVFVHGTGMSTLSSFGALHQPDAGPEWNALFEKFRRHIYAFEHRTFSQSPIDNALLLAKALPAGARLNVVTHSGGGLIGDLLCASGFDSGLVDRFERVARAGADADAPLSSAQKDLCEADKQDRRQLRKLDQILTAKNFRIERYVRVAAPARGSLLAGSNLDAFLSVLLHLVGLIPALQNPAYAVAKRVVLQIIKKRTDPRLVPGIEALLPGSPLGALLGIAEPKRGAEIAVIAGDVEGGGLLKRIGTFLTGYLFFDDLDNDLLVETDSMFGGVARAGSGVLFDRGADVSHFRYFANRRTRQAMRDWLTAEPGQVRQLPSFVHEKGEAPQDASTRAAAPLPARGAVAATAVVIVVPGFMGSHLAAGAAGRVWFDFAMLARGGLDALRYGTANVTPDGLLGVYDALCVHLARSHEVRRFAYDWRAPLAEAAARLAAEITMALRETRQPVRIVAHGMGGLVLRTLIARHRDAWDAMIRHPRARAVMLGTPNRGEHAMVETLLGLGEVVRQLARLDATHTMQWLLDMLAQTPGALQLLPRPVGAGSSQDDFFAAATWSALKQGNDDRWFGERLGAIPEAPALAQAQDGWAALDENLPDVDRIAYVAGSGRPTPCGLARETRAGTQTLALLRTPAGDGRVTHDSGLLPCLLSERRAWFADTDHLGLVSEAALLPALVELLESGDTALLARTAPALRGSGETPLVRPGPVLFPTPDGLARGVSGGGKPPRRRGPARYTLAVSARAMDLRYVTDPIIVGHYEGDPISAAESQIDQHLVENQLTLRKRLGVYAGAPGSATVVLLEAPAEQATARQRGAVVVGLGELGKLTATALTDAVRNGVLRYLLQIVDRQGGRVAAGRTPRGVGLTTLFLGYNSTTNISIDDSVQSVVRGVLAANRQFTDGMEADLRVTRLEFVELYLDVATSGAYAIRAMAGRMASEAGDLGARIDAAPTLAFGDGVRQRLEASAGLAYWPRLIITDPDRTDTECPPECFERPRRDRCSDLCPPECLDPRHATADRRAPLPTSPQRRAELPRSLRFVLLSQRARAEATELQRQPGLVETLVECSVRHAAFNADLARTLFQLLIPHDLKATVRQAETLVLVVDRYTAGMPWELLIADDEPLIKRTAIVRQFTSARFRTDVRSSQDLRAYVVGSPSTEGFYRAFPDQAHKETDALDALPGAVAEAQAVGGLLEGAGYAVTRAIDGELGIDVINKLFRAPYRIVHISGHGVFEHGDDDAKRSGVVLSDGLLLTAAEIRQMEFVPDLVFLNCCFLGQTDGDAASQGRGTPFNRLAHSVARELIDIGVRVVVAAGWAVRDDGARHFAEKFYQYLLLSRMSLGRATAAARRDTYQLYPQTNTWGAFQVYGDPGFVMDPSVRSNGRADEWNPVTPAELLGRLEALRVDAQQPEADRRRRGATQARLRSEERKLLAQVPRGWLDLPQVLYARARLAEDLGSFEVAVTQYRQAIAIEDARGSVPVTAIERLANVEARQGERTRDLELIGRAIERLEALAAAAGGTGPDVATAAPEDQPLGATSVSRAAPVNSERCALLGSAYKRRAAVLALTQKTTADSPSDPDGALAALATSAQWYARGEGSLGEPGFSPSCAQNRLALQAVLGVLDPTQVDQNVELARRAGEIAHERFQTSRDYYDLIMTGDGRLLAWLLDGSLADPKRADEAVDAIVDCYGKLRAGVPESERNFDSVLTQIRLLAQFASLRAAADGSAAGVSKSLQRILDALSGGASAPASATPPTPPPPTATGATAAAPRPGRAVGARRKPGRPKRS